jgi:predicted metal-dependent TIM-barrel fold hydrolase
VTASGRLVVLHAPSSVDAVWELEAWLGAIARVPELEPRRVLVAGLDERHLGMALEAGFWAGVAIDAHAGLTAEVVAELLDFYGVDGILLEASRAEDVNAVCAALRQRGHGDATLARLTHDNPSTFLSFAQVA